MSPSTVDIVRTLSNPFAGPIAFWTNERPGHSPYPHTDAPWRAMGWTTSAVLPMIHRPGDCSYESLDQTGVWLRFCVHAGMTAVLRCAAPPYVAQLAYNRAAQAGHPFAGCVGSAAGACALGCVVSALGMVINALHIVLGLAAVAFCVLLACYYFAQVSLDNWLPPPFVMCPIEAVPL